MADQPNLEHLATPRSVHAAAWAVIVTWAAAVVTTVLAILNRNWPEAVMAFVAALNAVGWWSATRRWVEWSTIAVGLLALLEAHGVRYWLDDPPE